MYRYSCHVCGGLCDAGELENGVCYDCREEEYKRQQEQSLKTRSEINQLIRARYAEQHDGQMVMVYGR